MYVFLCSNLNVTVVEVSVRVRVKIKVRIRIIGSVFGLGEGGGEGVNSKRLIRSLLK